MPTREVELSIGGMTCASCSRRVEKSLAKVDGVSATVNYATGVATVTAETQVADADLTAAVERAGYTAVVAGKATQPYGAREFRIRLLVSAVLTLPTMAVSMLPRFQFDYWQYLVAAAALPVATWSAWPFHRAALVNLRHRQVTMDTLVSVGVAVAYLWSVWALLFTHAGMVGMRMHASLLGDPGDTPLYFEVAASVTTLVVLGKYLEHRARNSSLAALEQLVSLNPTTAVVVRDGVRQTIPIEQVRVADDLEVATGSQIPVDAVVLSGEGHVDRAMITGESQPQRVSAGDAVIGATVLVDGALTVRATAVGKDTVLSGISRLVHQAQTGKAEVTRLVDRVSEVFVPVVIALAMVTFVGWLVTGHSAGQAMAAGIAVLVIACPCALGLATPTALLVGSGRGAQLGLLIRGPHALEASDRVSVMVLDKTGTLTDGRMRVVDALVVGDERRVWRAVSALEHTSTHPLAVALQQHADERGGTGASVSKVMTIAGSGVQGEVDGVPTTVGSMSWLGVPEGPLREAAHAYAARGDSVVVVYDDARCVAVIALADSVGTDQMAAVRDLEAMGVRPIVASGDHEAAVARVADLLGIAEYHSALSPQAKVELVADLQTAGAVVAMVGDGVNDAAALAKAHLSMAMGAGTDVAASAADIVLMRSSVSAAVSALRLARATMRTIRANLWWAFGYNVAAIPLAMSGRLGPIVASAAMAFSSVFVVTNSLRLRRFRG